MHIKGLLIAAFFVSFSGAVIAQDNNNDRDAPPTDRRAKNELLKGQYKSKIVAVAPIQFTENGIIGLSVSYEKALDKNDIVSFYTPVILEMRSNNSSSSGEPNNADPMFYVMPGIKIYPTGGYGLAKYAVGPSLVIADGSKTVNTGYDLNTGNEIYDIQSHFVLGMMINQSLNINPTPHLYLGTEFGFGLTYINDIGGTNKGTSGLVQFSFKIGYRY